MPKPRATSSTTSSGSTITYVCTLHWVICRPMYTNANRQPNHLSTCPKTLDHYTTPLGGQGENQVGMGRNLRAAKPIPLPASPLKGEELFVQHPKRFLWKN